MFNFSFAGLYQNSVLTATLAAFLFTQSIKLILNTMRAKRFDFRWFIGTGGMPSAHSAGAMALCTSIGFKMGFNSHLFAITAIFALVVMFDAQGVRRSIGRQAIALNKIMDNIYWKGKIQEEQVKELIGHTPIEVLVGGIIGILIALIFA